MEKLSSARRGRKVMRPLLLALAVTCLAAATGAAADEPTSPQPIVGAPVVGADLPDLGSPAAELLSKNDEYRLGAMVARELRDQNALLEDPEVSEYINGIGQRLASQSAMGGEYFHYFVIRDTTHQRVRRVGRLRVHQRWTGARHLDRIGARRRHGARDRAYHAAPHRAYARRPVEAEHHHRGRADRGDPAGLPRRRRPGHRRRDRRRTGAGGAAPDQLHARQRDGRPIASASATSPPRASIPMGWATCSRPWPATRDSPPPTSPRC